MCFTKKSKQTTTSNQTSTSRLSDWSRDQFDTRTRAVEDTLDDFDTNSPYRPYTGPLVADLSGGERRAREIAGANVGGNEGLFDDIEGLVREGAGTTWDPQDVGAGAPVNFRTFDAGRVRERYNPYEEDVVDAAGAFFDEQLGRQLNENRARAVRTGSYGGSRDAVVEGELRRLSAMDRGQMMADLRYRGWDSAVAGDERESQGLFAADTYNSDLDYRARRANEDTRGEATRWNADNRYRGAGLLSDLAEDRDVSWRRDVDMMERLGATEREIEEARILQERAQHDRQAADEWARFQVQLQTRLGLLGATPMTMDTTSTGTGTITGTQSGVSMDDIGGLLSGVGSAFTGINAFLRPRGG